MRYRKFVAKISKIKKSWSHIKKGLLPYKQDLLTYTKKDLLTNTKKNQGK